MNIHQKKLVGMFQAEVMEAQDKMVKSETQNEKDFYLGYADAMSDAIGIINDYFNNNKDSDK